MTEITTDLDGLTEKGLALQMVLRMDRYYERSFEHAIASVDAIARIEAANELIEGYAAALTDAGFPEIASQVLKVVSA